MRYECLSAARSGSSSTRLSWGSRAAMDTSTLDFASTPPHCARTIRHRTPSSQFGHPTAAESDVALDSASAACSSALNSLSFDSATTPHRSRVTKRWAESYSHVEHSRKISATHDHPSALYTHGRAEGAARAPICASSARRLCGVPGGLALRGEPRERAYAFVGRY